MAVTLTDQYGDTSTPTLTSGIDNCDYVLVVGADYVDRYGKTGDTSYRFALRSQGLGGLTTGHVIGVSYVEGGSGGGSVSAWGDLTGTLSDQTDLQSALDGKSDTTHVHAGEDVTTGYVDPSRLGTGSSITTKYLRGDGTWQTLGAGVTDLDGLSDVAITTPADKHTLVHNGSAFVNRQLSLADLSDVDTAISGSTNDFVVFGASDFEAQAPATARASLGVDKGCFTFFDAAPVDGTVCVCVRAPFACTIDSATFDVDSGTVTAAVKINTTAVTSLSAVSVTSTKGTTNATGANTVAEGDEINLTYSSASSPVNLRASINFTR